MNTPMKWRGTRAAAAVLAGALAALTLAMPASAATPNLVDPNAVGSLTIHKCVAPDLGSNGGNNGNGNNGGGNNARLAAPAACEPLDGVGFTVYRVDAIDLTANSGWTAANALSVKFDGTTGSITGAGYTVAPVGAQQFTANGGLITLTDLKLGLYYVVETAPLPGSTAVAPFLVTVPMTDPANLDNWLYDVDVYPKNALTSVDKTVADADAIKLGDAVDWTITADIPNVAVIDGYKITDVLDSKLDYVSTAVTLADGTPLAAGDYTVSFDAATNTVSAQFTAAGLLTLAAHTGTEVKVVISTTVNTVGEIANTALLYPNAGSFNIQPGQPGGPTETPEVVTKWGGLTVEKVDETGTALTGAVFSVYPTEADALAGTNAIVLGGATEFTVAADGTVTISGLRYSDWANGAAVALGDAGYQTYWLAELVAPAGYELLANPIEFTVTAATTAVGIDLEVVNVPSNAGFELPLTGGNGTVLFWAGGSMLLAGAVFLAVYSRRRSNSQA